MTTMVPTRQHFPKWILASASPRRREILSSLGLQFHIDPSHIEEPARRRREDAARYAVRAAQLKARAVAERYQTGIVIAADTIVITRNRILGKPSAREEGRRMLRALGGRWHEVVTGICLRDCSSGRTQSGHSRSHVRFRRLSAEEIEWYLSTNEYRDKAGAYAIQGYAALFIEGIRGCYFNVVGFPVVTFRKLCMRMGIDLLGELSLPVPR